MGEGEGKRERKEGEGKARKTYILPLLGLGGIVNQQSVEGQRVGKDVVANIVAANGQGIEGLRFTVADRHFDGFEVRIHGQVDPWREEGGLASALRRRREREREREEVPVMVPWTVVPFFNSIVTVSLLSFICRAVEGTEWAG